MDLTELDEIIEERRAELQKLEDARATLGSVFNGSRQEQTIPTVELAIESALQKAPVDLTGLSSTQAVLRLAETWRKTFSTTDMLTAMRTVHYLTNGEKPHRIYSAIYSLVEQGRLEKTKKGYRIVRGLTAAAT